MAFWTQALRLAGALVARQSVLPDLDERDGKFHARWRPVTSSADKGRVESRLEPHESLGTVAAAVLVLWGLARAVPWWRGRAGLETRRAIVALETAFSIFIVTTAFDGGQLVYEFGVNVARTASRR